MNIEDKPMIIHVLDTLNNIIDEAIIVLNDKNRIDRYRQFINEDNYDFKIIFVEDEIKNKGPLSGIKTGLENISSEYGLILPCDSPFITEEHVLNLFNEADNRYDCIVPYHDDENKLKTSEPLHGIYDKKTVLKINDLLKKDLLRIKDLIKESNCKYLKIDEKKLLKEEIRNLNYPEDI